jgi:alkanesulfonate monooxygenase SsuD/methylene tetrahydromethanopterin reductase-like flavin-dependent oxidoreductase (luciferase family)
MPDYGHDLLFGIVLTPEAHRPEHTVETAMLSEQLGLDLVSVPDHPYQPGLLDAPTLLTWIAARTSRIRLFANVTNLPLRPPAGIARSLASLDILSHGRAELGLGAGAYWDAIAGDGGPRHTAAESVEAFAEAVQVIRALWSDASQVGFDGRHYTLDGARPGPRPPHQISVWAGAIRPRMLGLIGTRADGWLPSATRVPPTRLSRGNQIIDDAALDSGRRPGDVRRLYNIPGTFATTAMGFLHGPPRLWVEQLAELTVEQGVSVYLFPSDEPDLIRRFALEVVPGVREHVRKARTC